MACVVGLIIPIWLAYGLGEPEIAVGPGRDSRGDRSGRGDGELGDGVRRRVDHPDLVGTEASVNQRLPSGPVVIPAGPLLAVGMGNSVMACVVGLIIPIWLAPDSVNQRLPSGPAVIPVGIAVGRGDGELGDGVRRRVDHPDLVGTGLGEPEIAVGPGRDHRGSCAVGNGELADGHRQELA